MVCSGYEQAGQVFCFELPRAKVGYSPTDCAQPKSGRSGSPGQIVCPPGWGSLLIPSLDEGCDTDHKKTVLRVLRHQEPLAVLSISACSGFAEYLSWDHGGYQRPRISSLLGV
jgi:hypothetical protein